MTPPTTDPISPRLSALQGELQAGNGAALDAFWRQVEAEGAPIVEPVAGDPSHVLVTFCWRDVAGDTRNVILEGGLGVSHDPRESAMAQLEGSDVWYRTYRASPELRVHYLVSPNDALDPEDWRERRRTFRADPLNARSFVWPFNAANPEAGEMRYSVAELEGAPPQPWAEPRADVAHGSVEEQLFRSEALGNERRVWIYRPAAFSTEGPSYPVMVLLDGWEWAHAMPVAPTLDNLIAEGAIPPIVVVMAESLDYLTRGVEYPCHEPFVTFLADELLPWARAHAHVTDDPGRTVVAGQSYGGIAATFAALRRPEVFGNVISQSGSFWWRQGWETADPSTLEEGGWLPGLVVREPVAPVRLYLDVGTFEYPEDRASNRQMRDALRSEGYDVTYREYEGGHHWLNWRGSLADALVLLTSDRRDIA